MISRTTARLIAEWLENKFRDHHYDQVGGRYYYTSATRDLYDFLFDNGYPAYFCNAARALGSSTREIKELIMKLHTGETVVSATPKWSWEARERLGQELLVSLAEDVAQTLAQSISKSPDKITQDKLDGLTARLELDGYSFRANTLLLPEQDVLDTGEVTGVLQTLFADLQLPDRETAFHHLQLSEEHFLAKRWDDSISNSRKFLEAVLAGVAASHGTAVGERPSDSVLTKPVRVREYLERESLVEHKETEVLSSVYGLLSETGGHPYMAANEQARLLRHLALTLSQFVMLRYKGWLSKGRT